MQATVERLEHSRVKLRVTVEAEVFGEAMHKSFLQNRGRLQVPGFRRGKAPRKMIEQYYGEGVFYEDAFDQVFRDTYPQAVEENDLNTVEDPTLDVEQIGAGEELIYTAEVTVSPEVILGAYKGIEVEKPAYPVGEDQIDAEIEEARDRVASWATVDGPAEMGHSVILDYAGTVDGKPFDGGTAEKQTLILGSGRFIPGMEEGVVGMGAGEEKDIPVTFPEDYHAAELAGKDAVFHVSVHEIQRKDLPEIDDELAKDVSEFETLDAYRESIRERLEKEAAERADAEYENALLEKIAENASVEIPDVMIDHQVDAMIREMSFRMMLQGMRFEDFLRYTGLSEEDLRGQHRPDAEKRVRVGLVLEAIQKAEGIEATAESETVRLEIERRAEARKQVYEEYREKMSEGEMQRVLDNAVTQEVVNFLRERAVS